MSTRQTPASPAERGGDDLDTLLRAYFRAQMPHPWPAMTPPAATVAGPRPIRRASLWRSRLALAASLALLFLGQWVLSGLLGVYPLRGPEGVSDGTATKPYLFPVEDRTPAGRKVLMKGSIIQEVEEGIGPDGKPAPQFKPRTIQVDVFEHIEP